MFTHDAITVLSTGAVVDKSKIAGLDAVAMSAFFAQTYGLGLPVTIVDSAGAFFLPRNLLAMLEAGDSNWELVAEKLEVKLTSDDLAVLKRAIEIRKNILTQYKNTYPFAAVPAGWSVLSEVNISKTKISRINGDHRGYFIGPLTLRRIWLQASKVWTGAEVPGVAAYLAVGGYHDKRVLYLKDHVEIGCQTVKRFELEQIALHFGWEFP